LVNALGRNEGGREDSANRVSPLQEAKLQISLKGKKKRGAFSSHRPLSPKKGKRESPFNTSSSPAGRGIRGSELWSNASDGFEPGEGKKQRRLANPLGPKKKRKEERQL